MQYWNVGMKRLILIFLSIQLFICNVARADYKALISIDMTDGRVLYQENARDENYPASLTKIMTLYLVFDALDKGRLTLNQNLIVSKSASEKPQTKLGLKPGEKISVETAIKALIIRSANDVATVLSENLTGDEGDFGSLMTRVASEIGLSKTNFKNASGLTSMDQVSTARDLALLSLAIYKHFPQYYKYFNERSFTYNGQTYYTHNQILNVYPGANGMKTGYTAKSGYNLVATAKRGDDMVMSVVLGSTSSAERLKTSVKLLDYSFDLMDGKKPGNFTNYQTKTTSNGNITHDDSESGTEQPKSSIKTTTKPIEQKNWGSGSMGVQFGAFSSKNAATEQQTRVKNLFGINTSVEQYSGLWRVRANKLSETSANEIIRKCISHNVQCFMFH